MKGWLIIGGLLLYLLGLCVGIWHIFSEFYFERNLWYLAPLLGLLLGFYYLCKLCVFFVRHVTVIAKSMTMVSNFVDLVIHKGPENLGVFRDIFRELSLDRAAFKRKHLN